MSTQYNLIVFDWDGTLMDSTAAICKSIQVAAEELGLPIPNKKIASHVIGLGLYEAMEVVMPNADSHTHHQMAMNYKRLYTEFSKEITLFDGVIEMLEELSDQNYTLAVATGKSRRGLNFAMEQTKTTRFFQATKTVDESFSKPHPGMLLDLTDELGMPLNQTVMVGDTTHDLLMAKNAGISSIGVQYGAHPLDELKRFNPLYIADSVQNLHRWLIQHA